MKLIIGDQEFNLKRSDVIAARTVINSFVDALRENSSFSLPTYGNTALLS